MAKRTLEVEMKISKEAQYENALKEIHNGTVVLNTELAKVNAQYALNSNSMEALTAKSDILNRKLLSQKDEVARLKDAVAEFSEKYGEADERTLEFVKKLNRAEASYYRTENAIEQNRQAMEKQSDTSKGAGDAVEELAKKFGITLPDGLTKSINSMGSFSGKTVAAMGAAAAAVAVLVKAEKQLMDMTIQAAASADDLLTKSVISGIDPEKLQQLQYASELVDVSTETIIDSQTKLIRSMNAARDGSSDAAKEFQKLGISATDSSGQLRDADTVFYEVIDALGQVENGTERDAAAMAILGKGARELNPLIVQGSDALKGLAAEAEKTGYVLRTDQVEALGKVDDAYQRLQLSQEAVRNQLAAQFAPAAESVLTKFAELIQDAGDAMEESGIGKNLGVILDSTITILTPLGKLAAEILPLLGAALKPVAGLIAWIADAADVVTGLLTLDFDRIGVALGYGQSSGRQSNLQKWMSDGTSVYDEDLGAWVGNYTPSFNASGNDNFKGGVTRVGENGPETVILPAGSRIMSNQETRETTGGVYIGTVVIDAKNVKDFNDVVNVFSNLGRFKRMRGYT